MSGDRADRAESIRMLTADAQPCERGDRGASPDFGSPSSCAPEPPETHEAGAAKHCELPRGGEAEAGAAPAEVGGASGPCLALSCPGVWKPLGKGPDWSRHCHRGRTKGPNLWPGLPGHEQLRGRLGDHHKARSSATQKETVEVNVLKVTIFSMILVCIIHTYSI